MENLEELFKQQAELGGEIQRLISNYKKDSSVRKRSQTYHQDRLDKLTSLYETFEQQDSKIRTLCDNPLEFEYFSNGLYDKIADLSRHYTQEFAEHANYWAEHEMSKAPEPHKTATTNTPVPPTRTTSGQTSSTHVQPLAVDCKTSQTVRNIRRQQAILSSLRRLLHEEVDEQQIYEYYEVKLDNMRQLWRQIEELNFHIWEESTDPSAEGYDHDGYLKIESEFRKHMFGLIQRTKASTNTTNQSNLNVDIQLPRISLQPFDGNYLKWRQFFEMFNDLIHKKQISTIQKMWYLKSNLTGEAERLIKHLPITESNYNTAWQMLQDRYNNKRVLALALLQKLLEQPSANSNETSASFIKSLHDTTIECLNALDNLGIETTSWGPVLLYTLQKKLDKQSNLLYEQSLQNPREIPAFKSFLSFLETRFQYLESAFRKETKHFKATTSLPTVTTSSTKFLKCKVCDSQDHNLFACKRFLQMTSRKRWDLIKRHNLCINCLKATHKLANCPSRSCLKCNKRHNTLLHFEETDSKESATTSSASPSSSSSASHPPDNSRNQSVSLTASPSNHQNYVMLATAKIKVASPEGRVVLCLAVLDSGSQINILSERLVNKLKMPTRTTSLWIRGVGAGNLRADKRVIAKFSSITGNYSSQIEAFVLPTIISNQPMQTINTSTWEIPKNIKLADPDFARSDKVDVLLGAEFYFQLLSIGQIKLNDVGPILQNTLLGWVVAGSVKANVDPITTCGICSESEDHLGDLIEKFWKLEEINEPETGMTQAENHCEAHFAQNTTRNSEGRYLVRLPFCGDPSSLGNSQNIALSRFLAIERRLTRDDTLRSQYVEFMEEYERLGHMSKINHEEILSPNYVIPHHCIFKPHSTTTKLRVVFDASAKSSSGISLNDILHNGPTVQQDLFALLLKFRLPRFVFTADVEKMFRQIIVHPADRRYQMIIWRSNPQKPLNYYTLNTVTYGTRSATYLSTKCLQKLSREGAANYPLGSKLLAENFYVDDGLAGSDSISEAMEMLQQLNKLLASGGFKLRKWCANHAKLLQGIALEDQEVNMNLDDGISAAIKTLGLTWIPKLDVFCIKTTMNKETRVTKRIVCSELAKIFDPLGILAPVIITAKIFIQELWNLKVHWDEALPAEMHTRWTNFRSSLDSINGLQIARHMFRGSYATSIQLHGFADASEKAYGAAIYVRSILPDKTVHVRLLSAKSRVAPLKRQTIPRLELCAALLCAQLMNKVKTILGYKGKPTYLWTDSQIVLAWIFSGPAIYKTFVANRVVKILELSIPAQWRHVGTKENPADLVSRGISTKQLVACNIWFYGPRFLHGSESTWPSPLQKEHVIPTDKERKQSVNVLATTNSDLEELIYKIDHRNSFLILQRVVAYVLRFIRNVKKTTTRTEGRIHLTLRELHKAMTVIIKVVQYADFKADIDRLNENGNVEKTSPLLGLSPFIDEEGVLRVGGRLSSSSLQYNAKYPILLPYNDKITRLIMEMYHKNNLHCGPQALLGYTRQKFWPLKAKTMARSIVQKCIKCSRAKPKLLTQIMGNLPEHRVQPARPFINSGVDFCGPCHIHYNIRGKRPTKAYIAIFCCFATKAVHLELVTDLSTDAFLCALKRFIARRGHCLNIYCDNATNFVGANNQLKELQHSMHSAEAQDKIIRTCTKRGINFKFIPPRAPHFGGLWEAAVKSAKGLLVKAVASFSLTYEELETTIIEIEAVLNSRPLTEMSSNPNDLAALTPGHFLIGEPLTAQVDALADSNKTSLGKRWKLISQIKNDFWKRWSREYLSELQQKSRWKSPCQNIEVNRLVAIKEDNIPPLEWSLGRIIEIYKGDDNMARVAKIKTAKGIWKRPIHKLALLPTDVQPDDHPEKAPDKTDDIPAKRSRVTSPISLLMLASLLILPIVVTSPVTLSTFPDKPGLHFENIGKIHIVMAEWKLLIYYDLAPVRNNLQKYRDGIFTLDNLCIKMHTQLGCNMLVTQFRQSQDQIQLDNSLFVPQRQRRAALDIVGNVARSLFGVLDSEYAEEMSTTIQHISQNEDHIIKLLRNQTSIINSTLNIIKADQINIDKKFIEIDKELDSLKNIIGENRDDLLRIKVFEIFTFLAVQLSMIRVDMQRVQDLLLDVLTDVHHGKINPLIMTPDQLSREIVTIKTHLDSSLQVPVQTKDFMRLYQLMKVKAGISKDHIIFQVRLPLTGHNPFILFKILPAPVFKNNIMVSIAKSTNMLAVTPHRDQYFPIDDSLSESCTNIDDSEYLCSNINTIFTRESEVCACEINLLNNQSTTHCSLQVSNLNVSFSKMATANQWIYAARNPLNLMAVCGSRTQQVTLRNSGIMHIPPGCTLKGDAVTIHTSHITNTSSITSYTSFPDLPQALFTNKTVNRDVTSKTIHYENQLQKLTELQEELNNNNILELPHQITSDRLHHMTIGYSALTLAVILLAIIVIKRTRRSRKSRDVKPPQPLPRMQQVINSIELQETKPNAAEDVSS